MLFISLTTALALLSAVFPSVTAKKGSASSLLSCVQDALIGDFIDYRIVTPDSEYYEVVSTGAILVNEYPAMVVYATQTQEVVNLVKCGVANGYNVTPRSGAHHFENWSALNGTLVVDVSHINYVQPSSDLTTAKVGGGALMGTIYSILGQYDRTWIGAICPSVGLGGYISVGGYNMQMRTEGLAVDAMESAQVVLANGKLVTVSAKQNPDLWWAMRGGGTFGITVEVTITLTTLPRSAMVYMYFPNASRFDSLSKYINWAPATNPNFNTQLNFYGDYNNVVGWLIGGSVEELTAMVDASGLADVEGAEITISGNCSTENSRNFWTYLQTTCTDDATAHTLFNEMYNVVPDDLIPVNNISYGFNDTPALPNENQADLWGRAAIIDKNWIKPMVSNLTDEDIQWIVDSSAALPAELGVWAEITTWNMTAAAPTTSSFAWFENSQMLWRFEVNSNVDAALLQQGQDWINQLDALLQEKFGHASYAGYVDGEITGNPQTAYWGSNVARLAKVKAEYDPSNLFSNPFSINPAT